MNPRYLETCRSGLSKGATEWIAASLICQVKLYHGIAKLIFGCVSCDARFLVAAVATYAVPCREKKLKKKEVYTNLLWLIFFLGLTIT